MASQAWPKQVGPTTPRPFYLLQISDAGGGGSCSQVDSPVAQRASLPLVVVTENVNPLQGKTSPFISGSIFLLEKPERETLVQKG